MQVGDRIYLRPHTLEDADEFYKLNLDKEVIKYTGDSAFESVDDAASFLKSYLESNEEGFGRYALILIASNEYVGWCGLKRHDSFIDLGYRLNKRFWGMGLATEAAKISLEHGFNRLNLVEIVGRTHPENIASVRILEKLGMSFSGIDSCNGIDNAHIYKIDRWQFQQHLNG